MLWRAAGRPHPCDVIGTPIEVSRTTGRCSSCGAQDAAFHARSVVSGNFLPTRNANRIGAFGGDHFCAACTFAARTLRLRCISWTVTEDAVTFWRTRPEAPGLPRPDVLAMLLDPPAPPFAVGIPLTGIAHGGEAHWKRTWWPGEQSGAEPLIRLQSKHVAMYARVATSRDQFPVQVDDALDFVLDRTVWSWARDHASAAARLLTAEGVPGFRARAAIRTLALRLRVSPAAARAWPAITAPLRPLSQAAWWPLFCDFIHIEETPTDAETDDRAAAP